MRESTPVLRAQTSPSKPASTATNSGSAALAQSRELASADVDRIAKEGTAGASDPLPHGATIQACFGHHDISNVRTRTGGAAQAAAEALGANAYARHDRIAFAQSPSLHTAAHEAAHVVQQQSAGAVQFEGALGDASDVHEQHANAVADAVVAGRSAEGLLDARPSGPPRVQRDEHTRQKRPRVRSRKPSLDARVARYGDAVADDAADAVEGGAATQRPVDVKPGITALVDPATGVILMRRPHRLGDLVDLVDGGRVAAVAGRTEHRRAQGWTAVDPIAYADRIVLPGEQVRFFDADGKALAWGGRRRGVHDAIKFKTAATPLREAARAWADGRAAQQSAADAHALSLSFDAVDNALPFAAYSLSVELPGMRAACPLYVYDFLKSAYDTVHVHGDLRGANPVALRAAVLDADPAAGIPTLQGTRVLSFEMLGPDELVGWVETVDAADRAAVDANVAKTLQKKGIAGIEGLKPREIAQASPERQAMVIERVLEHCPTGDASGKRIVEITLQCMSASNFKAMCTRFVTGGTMNAFGHWVDGDPRLMWIFGEQLVASGITHNRGMLQHDADGEAHSVPQGCMLWVGKNPTWGGWSRSIEFAGNACTVQIGDRGVFGDLADTARDMHGLWKKNTKASRENNAGMLMAGMLDFLVEMGIGSLDMLDRPTEVVKGLKLLCTQPGVVFDAMRAHLKDRWSELMDMARAGNLSGDYGEYYYHCGKWISGLLSAITSAAGTLRLGQTVVKGMAKLLRPRNMAGFLRGLLKRTGRLVTQAHQGQTIYSKIRNYKGLMRVIRRRTKRLDGALLKTRKRTQVVDEFKAALEQTAEGSAAHRRLQRRIRKASRKAKAAQRVVKVRRASLGRLLAERGVLGAEHLTPDQLVKLCKALDNPDMSVRQITQMRRGFLTREVPATDVLTPRQAQQQPLIFGERIAKQANTLKKNTKGKRVSADGQAARKSLDLNFKAIGLDGADTLTNKQMQTLAKHFETHRLQPVSRAASRLDADLRAAPNGELPTETINTHLEGVASTLQKAASGKGVSANERLIWERATNHVRGWIEDAKDFGGYFDPCTDLNQLVKRTQADLIRARIAQVKQEWLALRIGLPLKSQPMTTAQARQALARALKDDTISGAMLHMGRHDISQFKFVDNLPEEVVVRLANLLREKKVDAFRHQIRHVRRQGLGKTLNSIDEASQVKAGLAAGANTNVAKARIDIEGVERELLAVSGEKSPSGTVGISEDPIFETRFVDHDRRLDSEAKILEAIAKKLGKNHDCQGSITLLSERPCCPSCLGVIQQFKKRYPNVSLQVYTGL